MFLNQWDSHNNLHFTCKDNTSKGVLFGCDSDLITYLKGIIRRRNDLLLVEINDKEIETHLLLSGRCVFILLTL